MLHQPFDLAYWKHVFSLSRLRNEAQGKPPGRQPRANSITGPYDVAIVEQQREEVFTTFTDMERVPTDIFVWSLGEPERREVTKIGGLPYWEKGRSWPRASSGAPMTFIAQFCFADSYDIVPALPGDLLLIFIEGVDWTEGWEEEAQYTFMWEMPDESASEVQFEWVALHDRPLITSQDVPTLNWDLVPFWGSIHRTWDYARLGNVSYPEKPQQVHVSTVFEGTKIGGLCPLPTSTWFPHTPDETAQYLCTLNSLSKTSDTFPFLNVSNMNDPIAKAFSSSKHEFLMFGDLGFMNIFLSQDGVLYWGIHNH